MNKFDETLETLDQNKEDILKIKKIKKGLLLAIK